MTHEERTQQHCNSNDSKLDPLETGSHLHSKNVNLETFHVSVSLLWLEPWPFQELCPLVMRGFDGMPMAEAEGSKRTQDGAQRIDAQNVEANIIRVVVHVVDISSHSFDIGCGHFQRQRC